MRQAVAAATASTILSSHCGPLAGNTLTAMTVTGQLLERPVMRTSGRAAWFQYSAAVIIFTGVLLIFLAMIHVRGGFFHPAWFPLFRRLFYLQYALFGGALLATLLYLAPRRVGWFGRALLFAPFHLGCCWLVLWCLVHRTFGIELTPGTLFAVLTNQAPIATMGVNASRAGMDACGFDCCRCSSDDIDRTRLPKIRPTHPPPALLDHRPCLPDGSCADPDLFCLANCARCPGGAGLRRFRPVSAPDRAVDRRSASSTDFVA